MVNAKSLLDVLVIETESYSYDLVQSCPITLRLHGMHIITDAEISSRLTPLLAVDAMGAALAAEACGKLACPPRLHAPLRSSHIDAGTLVFTAGATNTHLGYRSYVRDRQLEHGEADDQLVTAFDRRTGELVAIAVGSLLGMRRTGALGGVAARYLAGEGPHKLAFIGAGNQARQQLWALQAVVDIATVRVYSRTPANREALAEEARNNYGLRASAVDSAEEAVREASIVVIATGAKTPVIETAWLAPDCLVATLGESTTDAAEIPADLFNDAYVVTDALAQCTANPAALLPAGGADAVTPLGQIATGQVCPPTDGRRIYLSRGLAGTEVALLAALANATED